MSDPYNSSVVLLLHMTGTNGSTSLPDSSSIKRSTIAYGNAAISTTQSKWGGGSGAFDGSGDYILLPNDGGLNNFGTWDYTIEAWVRTTDNTREGVIISCASSWTSSTAYNLEIRSTGDLRYYAGNNAPIQIISGAGAISNNTWYHVAVSRVSGTTKLFINGVSVGTPHTGSVSIGNSSQPKIGIFAPDNSAGWNGYINDMRITNGIGRYSSNFPSPASQFDDPQPISGVGVIPAIGDIVDGGLYQIVAATSDVGVSELGVPGSYRIRLFDRQSARLIRELWSNTDGTYAFNNIAYRNQGYFLVAHDHTIPLHNSAISDFVTPTPMS